MVMFIEEAAIVWLMLMVVDTSVTAWGRRRNCSFEFELVPGEMPISEGKKLALMHTRTLRG